MLYEFTKKKFRKLENVARYYDGLSPSLHSPCYWHYKVESFTKPPNKNSCQLGTVCKLFVVPMNGIQETKQFTYGWCDMRENFVPQTIKRAVLLECIDHTTDIIRPLPGGHPQCCNIIHPYCRVGPNFIERDAHNATVGPSAMILLFGASSIWHLHKCCWREIVVKYSSAVHIYSNTFDSNCICFFSLF